MRLDLVAGIDQRCLIIGLGRLDGTVELCVDLGRQRVMQRIERLGERVYGIVLAQLLTDRVEFLEWKKRDDEPYEAEDPADSFAALDEDIPW